MAKVVPLSKIKHEGLCLQETSDLSEFSNVSTLPIYGIEIPRLALEYPLVLIKQGDKLCLHLLCSLSNQLPNAWVTPNGKWSGTYLPAIIRQRPFTVLFNENKQRILCIDEESPLIGSDGGHPLFENGEPTEQLNGISQFIKRLFHSGSNTQQAVDLLQKYELVVPWSIKIRQPESEEVPVEGIYRVDESRLNDLEDEAWLSLRKAGAIPLVYGLLLSMANINKLVKTLKIRVEAESCKAAAEYDLDAFFGEDNDKLSFEDL
jgi:hypothetical protein